MGKDNKSSPSPPKPKKKKEKGKKRGEKGFGEERKITGRNEADPMAGADFEPFTRTGVGGATL